MTIFETLAQELNLTADQVEKTVALIDEGNTIPFIARYRKEVTGSLDDAVLRTLDERLNALRNLEKRREAELAKYGFVLFAAAYMSENMEKVRTLKGCLPVLIAGGAICALILLEPNMSITMCVGLIMLCMLFLGAGKAYY